MSKLQRMKADGLLANSTRLETQYSTRQKATVHQSVLGWDDSKQVMDYLRQWHPQWHPDHAHGAHGGVRDVHAPPDQ